MIYKEGEICVMLKDYKFYSNGTYSIIPKNMEIVFINEYKDNACFCTTNEYDFSKRYNTEIFLQFEIPLDELRKTFESKKEKRKRIIKEII